MNKKNIGDVICLAIFVGWCYVFYAYTIYLLDVHTPIGSSTDYIACIFELIIGMIIIPMLTLSVIEDIYKKVSKFLKKL